MNALLTTLVVTALVGAESSQLEWHSDYGKALNAARREGRPLLVVLEKPTTAKNVGFSKEALVENVDSDLLRPYELCRVDVSTEYGERVAKAFKVDSFPHTVITDKGASKMVYRRTGSLTKSQWKTALVSYKNVELRRTKVVNRAREFTRMQMPSRAFCPT